MKFLGSNKKIDLTITDLKSKEKNISSVMKHLLKKSSVYAVSQVGQSTTSIQKILWLMVLLTAVVGCGFQVYRFLNLYFRYPVIVHLNIEQEPKQSFPVVTVCNLNRLNSQLQDCITENGTVDCQPNLQFPMVGSSYHPLVVSERQAFLSCRSILSGQQQKQTSAYATFLNAYSKVSEEERKSIGYKAEDIIIKCSFNGVKCDVNDFYEFQNLQYGNCFTFKKQGHLVAGATPYVKGLELVINTRTDEYMDISHTLGSRILVHDSDDEPNPEQSGINVSPGYEVSISLKQTKMVRLPAPYKDQCIHYKSGEGHHRRSPTTCMQACMQSLYYEKCGCIEPTLLKIENKRQCNISNSSEMCCLDGVLENLQKHGSSCECPLSCITPYYHERISMAAWPSEAYFHKYITGGNFESYRGTHVMVKLYYSTQDIISYEQTPVFQNSELLSHLGGEFGLWLGLSLAALFELLEVMMHLVHYAAA